MQGFDGTPFPIVQNKYNDHTKISPIFFLATPYMLKYAVKSAQKLKLHHCFGWDQPLYQKAFEIIKLAAVF